MKKRDLKNFLKRKMIKKKPKFTVGTGTTLSSKERHCPG